MRSRWSMFSIGLASLLGASGCASSPYQTTYPSNYPPQQHQSAGHYTSAPGAPVAGELFLCPGRVSNSGQIGPRRESLEYTPYIYAGPVTLLRNPTASACMSSGFGHRNFANGGGRNHKGLDLANAQGGYIYSASSGRVISLGVQSGYGLTVEIDHGAGVRTLYAHLAETDPGLRVGHQVGAGVAIGWMGKTGNASGVHLHYEVRIHGQQVNPLTYGTYRQEGSPAYPGA